ncbi:6-phosphofructokinase [Methylocapsa sp. S129]|uniref:6-phosphofructokinase n=1 Tax=Methylocapsa sp. S129 TaxID=1641869 RepID=UPI00131B7EC4|nr:6-phosphofructokinase [Methylocapsa sp. S129]
MVQKILVAQGGGPTAVINQSLVGVALEARKFASVERVYGAAFGVRGIVNEDFVDLSRETSRNLEAVANTPSSALGSTRDKPDLAYCQEILKVLKAHAIGHFFYIGGNDSSDTVRIVADEARKSGYALRCVHIPKTIDNDLVGNDHTPGFPSAARFVTQAFMGVNLDNAALKGVYCAVIMGRHAGFLTAASALARKFPDDGPHLIYLPERTFTIDGFLADVKATFEKHGRCIIAASEGIHDEQGAPIITKLASTVEKDAHGNVQLSGTGALADLLCEEIKTKLGIKRVRGDTFGYLQRSFAGCVSDVDQREAREVGEKAVQYALWGQTDGSVAIQRTGAYAVDYPLIPLENVAGKTRVMEDEFITKAGNDVTEAFHSYLRPLLGAGLPEVERLRMSRVAKILK